MVIALSSCVIVQVTLSAPCMRWLSPWLLALSRFQVPPKFAGAAACTARVNMSALVRLKAPIIFLIQDLLQKHSCFVGTKTPHTNQRFEFFGINNTSASRATQRVNGVYQSDHQNTVSKCKELYRDGKEV